MKEDLGLYIAWPANESCLWTGIKQALSGLKRFVDFDGTITVPGSMKGRTLLRGRPLAEFLGEEPYAVQTWNPVSAIRFFDLDRPDLPKPRLILMTPMYDILDGDLVLAIGKDFSLLGITGVAIFDDMPSSHINAPGCVILPP